MAIFTLLLSRLENTYFKDINKQMTKSQNDLIILQIFKTSCYVRDLSRYYIVPVICIFPQIECMFEKISFKLLPEIETLENIKGGFFQKVSFVFQISKSPKNYPELEIFFSGDLKNTQHFLKKSHLYQCHHLHYVNSFKKFRILSCKSTG